jgi:hypothetical protein
MTSHWTSTTRKLPACQSVTVWDEQTCTNSLARNHFSRTICKALYAAGLAVVSAVPCFVAPRYRLPVGCHLSLVAIFCSFLPFWGGALLRRDNRPGIIGQQAQGTATVLVLVCRWGLLCPKLRGAPLRPVWHVHPY